MFEKFQANRVTRTKKKTKIEEKQLQYNLNNSCLQKKGSQQNLENVNKLFIQRNKN